MKIIGQIFEEEDYRNFRRLPDNRDVLGQRVNKLIASINEHYVLNPIVVNEKMEIIDGQGRFDACKALGKPIHYIIAPGANSDDCRRMNKYNTKWSTLDFAKSYAKSNVSAYINLLSACKKTSLPIMRVLRLANHSTKNGHSTEKMSGFEKGELIFSTEDVDTVVEIEKKVNEIIDALQFSGRKNEAFYISVKIASETNGYDHSRMIKNCKAQRSTYSQMSRLQDELVEFERIYNYKAGKNNRLYFSDYMRNRGANVRDYSKTYSPYNDVDISTLKED